MKIYFKIILALLFFYTALAAKENEKVSLQLHWLNQFQFAGYYMAKEKGFYNEMGLDVEIKNFAHGIDPLKEVSSNNATYAISRASLIVAKSKGAKIHLLAAIFQSSPLILLATKESHIRDIKGFKAKRVMPLSNPLDLVSIQAMNNQQGIERSDVIPIKHSYDINDLINHKTDLMVSYISNEPFLLKEKGIAYTIFNPKDYGFDFYSDLLFTSQAEVKNHPSRVKNFTSASLKGWKYAFSHIEESVALILKKYNSQGKSKEALLYEAHALKKLAYFNDLDLGHIDGHKIQRIYDIFNLFGYVEKKIDIDTFIYHDNAKKKLTFTLKQQQWIDAHPVLTYSEVNWNPSSVIKNGNMHGIMGDYLDLVSKKTGLTFVFKPSHSWDDVLRQFKEKKIDIIPGVDSSLKEKNLGLFSDTYAQHPMVIVTDATYKYIENLDLFTNKTIAVPENYTSHQFIKKHYPDIKIMTTKSIQEALLLVKSGEADAYVGHIAPALHYISALHLDDLKISGLTTFKFKHHYLIQKTDSELLAIINKALLTITEKEKKEIYDNWVSATSQKVIDYTVVWQLIAGFLTLLFIVSYFLIMQSTLKNEIQAQKETFETIYQKSSDGVFIIEDGKFVDCNESIVKMLGYPSREKVLDLHPSDLSPEFQPDGRASLEKANEMMHIAIETGSNNFEWMHTRKNGENFWAEIVLTKVYLNHKDLIHVVWRDIQTRKELEAEILQINSSLEKRVQEEVNKNRGKDKQLLQQSRMAQMGEMISMIAHQWRQPLGAIAATSIDLKMKMMFESYNLDNKEGQKECAVYLDEQLTNIETYVESLSTTIDDFRNFYKPNKEKKLLSINVPIQKSLSIIEASAKANGVEIITHFKSQKTLEIYDSELMQVFLNIIKNAQDNFKEKQIANASLMIETKDTLSGIEVSISDNGGGIPDAIITKIFDPYFSTKDEKNGTGLGLYMSKTIIQEHHDGKLSVKNNDTGVTFSITLKG